MDLSSPRPLALLSSACREYFQTHFIECVQHPEFYSLQHSLLKEALNPGLIECDTPRMLDVIVQYCKHQLSPKAAPESAAASGAAASGAATAATAAGGADSKHNAGSKSKPHAPPSGSLNQKLFDAEPELQRLILSLLPPSTMFNLSNRLSVLGVRPRNALPFI
jgi:hypothetical protein